MRILNKKVMDSLSSSEFNKSYPFPFASLKDFIVPEEFLKLHADFPALEKFEYHEGIQRMYHQRSHNRYYAAFKKSIYKSISTEGVFLSEEDLSKNWVEFITELETDPSYHKWVSELFGTDKWSVRFAWHIGKSGNEVSPHLDDDAKLGTHIFYFNTSEDWNENWGGQLLVLGEKMNPKMNPDVEDFLVCFPCKITDNQSFIFKNSHDAWHGVKPLKAPQDKHRRLFNVIFEKK